MKYWLPLVSCIGLALVLVPACLYLADAVEKPAMRTLMLLGTVLWFASAPLWLGRRGP